jgi:5-methylcytosine-specific restriction protein A
MGWENSDRRSRLPPNWPTLVAQVKRRARGRCEATHHAPGCLGRGRDVDHIVQGDDHSLANLQLLSIPCHMRKTRLDNGYSSSVKAPTEQHPGRLK